MKVILTEDVEDFIRSLDIKGESRARMYLLMLQRFGNLLRMPYSRNLLPGIFELRVTGENNLRLIYVFIKDSAIVFHVFSKKTQKTGNKEMKLIKNKFRYLQL
ncbi:MAG: type II toxin-antitoxin system RelE/ParE family toxin [Candidatus Paceibacterota bacterium]|jgi:phage-related protein